MNPFSVCHVWMVDDQGDNQHDSQHYVENQEESVNGHSHKDPPVWNFVAWLRGLSSRPSTSALF